MQTYIKLVNGKWHAFGVSGTTCYSIGRDNVAGYSYGARLNNAGIIYVSSPSDSKDNARKKAARNGEYMGVME